MHTHNICFHGDTEKIVKELIPNIPPQQVCYFFYVHKIYDQLAHSVEHILLYLD